MSSISEMDLDLEKLFQPVWAQEKPKRATVLKNSPATKASNPSVRSAASPANAARHAAMVPAAVNVVAARRAAVPNLANAKVEISVTQTGAMIAANVPRRPRPCRKSASRFCPAKTALNHFRARSR
jgi:hypothetical protein